MLFLFRLGARRQVAEKLRNGYCHEQLRTLFGLETAPHGDTLNDAFRQLSPDEFQEVVCRMTETLVRHKTLYVHRLLDQYYVAAIDGTETLSLAKRHCPHCLTRTHKSGKTDYYHPVLETKIVTPDGCAFSLMTEFVENPGENPTKQDCELKGFYRLAQRLKKRFPRLPLSLALDGLYACGPVFDICRRSGWKFMITLKADDLPSVDEEFEALLPLQPENRLSRRTGKKAEIRQALRWVDNIAYVDSEGREHTLTVIECVDERSEEGEIKVRKFRWVTNHKVSHHNVVQLANEGGRIRWKIENEGFNVQKNGGYGLEHAYTDDPTAAKVFYYLLQIAHALAQLIERGSLLRLTFSGNAPTGRDLAFRQLEAWRNAVLTAAVYTEILAGGYQIRLDSS